MAKQPLNEEIKVRVWPWLKECLSSEAQEEDLELSDIVRRALKQYAKRRSHTSDAQVAA